MALFNDSILITIVYCADINNLTLIPPTLLCSDHQNITICAMSSFHKETYLLLLIFEASVKSHNATQQTQNISRPITFIQCWINVSMAKIQAHYLNGR